MTNTVVTISPLICVECARVRFDARTAWSLQVIDVSRCARGLRPVVAAAIMLFGLAAPAPAEEPGATPIFAVGSRIEERAEGSRLVFDLSKRVAAAAFAVEGPKIVVELPEIDFRIDPALGRESPSGQSQSAGRGAKPQPVGTLIKSYRFGQFAPGRSRVVIELSAPARVARIESADGAVGARLEIDLAAQDAEAFARAVAEHARAALAEPARSPAPAAPSGDGASALPLVVIDPGHGGVDIGASSRHGEIEKSIVFEFAKVLKAKIEERGQQRVLLTRSDDVFVALDERVRVAQEHGAALLLSIHADTLSGTASVRGATVYTSAARASDAEAARIAAKENQADEAAGLEHKDETEEVDDILLDLTRRETRALSRSFAAALIDKWRAAGSLNKNPARSAHLRVLKAHDVPAALLELGYLSSDRDLADLTSPQWRERAAQGVADAIAAYFQLRERNARADAAPTASLPTRRSSAR